MTGHETHHARLRSKVAESETVLSASKASVECQNRYIVDLLDDVFKKRNTWPNVLRYANFATGFPSKARLVEHLNRSNSLALETNDKALIDEFKAVGLNPHANNESYALFYVDFSDDSQYEAIFRFLEHHFGKPLSRHPASEPIPHR